MARKPRLHFPGAIYHVSLRANGAQRVFTEVADYTRLLLLLQEGIEKFRHQVHAYVLLPTEIRLVVAVDEVPLARIMQQLGFRYTRWFNDYHQQQGHLFQGRYKAILIDPERYLLPLVRDLHLAPVTSAVDNDPMSYPWSSHRACCGREKVLWLTQTLVLAHFEETGIRALMRFHAYVNEGPAEPAALNFYRGGDYDPRVLGDKDYARSALKLARQARPSEIDPEPVLALVLRDFNLTEAELAAAGKNRQCSQARAFLGWLCLETGCMTLTALGERLGRDVSSLSSAIRRLQLAAKKDPTLSERYQQLRKKL
ncbi:MAG TPA: transposase [Pelovirga sp.]|nr:transposase [Pelovirga sp.]